MFHVRGNSRLRRRGALISFFCVLIGVSASTALAQTVCPDNTTFNNCGIPAASWPTEEVTVTQTNTTSNWYGVYLKWNAFRLNDLSISTRGSGSDAIRTDEGASWLFANRLTVTTTGSNADGINVASNGTNPDDTGVAISDYANITVTSGMGVRVNALFNTGANSIAVLPSGSTIRVTGTGTATQGSYAGNALQNLNVNAYGYGLYAGNRSRDVNRMGTTAIAGGTSNNTLGNAYAFVGSDSTISDSMTSGHAVYANKGGFIQLGDSADISATGRNAYALYAATEQQGEFTTNVRPGTIFLEGGATLRVSNGAANAIVMQANGADSIIANRAIDISNLRFEAPSGSAFVRMVNPPNKTAWTETDGVFDVIGIVSAINGGAVALNMIDGSNFLGATAKSASPPSTIDLNIEGATSQWRINADSMLSILNLDAGATLTPFWTAANDPTAYQLQGVFNSNGGILDLVNSKADGDTFTVIGDYAASGDAQLHLDTVLDGDASPTDKLVIDGSTSGTTTLYVNAVGGAGAQTGDGILVVEVTGVSDGEFVLGNAPLIAGDYEYTLSRGASNPNNWYLISSPKGKPPIVGASPTSPVPTLGHAALALLALLLAGGAMMVAARRAR